MFGRERSGLTNDEIYFADEIMHIRIMKANPSLNLAQAVAIMMYELSKYNEVDSGEVDDMSQKATQLKLSYLIKHLERELKGANFFSDCRKKLGMKRNMRNMIMRMKLSSAAVRTIRHLINAMKRNRN